ncbi:MAG: hypothetical protein ACTSUJ_07740 [Candidatus Njordarchaeales archaeon]
MGAYPPRHLLCQANQILRLVGKFAKVKGEFYSKIGGRGRRLSYDPVIVVTILIYKTALSIGYSRLKAKIRELEIDARLLGRRRSWRRKIPSSSLLKNIARKELSRWLDDFIKWLLRVKLRDVAPLVKIKHFVLNGTKMMCNRLVKRIYSARQVFKFLHILSEISLSDPPSIILRSKCSEIRFLSLNIHSGSKNFFFSGRQIKSTTSLSATTILTFSMTREAKGKERDPFKNHMPIHSILQSIHNNYIHALTPLKKWFKRFE